MYKKSAYHEYEVKFRWLMFNYEQCMD